MTTTINTTFDPASLPTWARRYPAVVALAQSNLSFRCDVHAATSGQMRRLLQRQAELRLWPMTE